MSKFNYHFNNHFANCPVIAKAYDPHRKRDVTLHHVPGNFELVGVTDGTDCWCAPVIANPFSVNVIDIFKQIRSGVDIKDLRVIQQRRKVEVPQQVAQPVPKRRVTVAVPDEPIRRRRVVVS